MSTIKRGFFDYRIWVLRGEYPDIGTNEEVSRLEEECFHLMTGLKNKRKEIPDQQDRIEQLKRMILMGKKPGQKDKLTEYTEKLLDAAAGQYHRNAQEEAVEDSRRHLVHKIPETVPDGDIPKEAVTGVDVGIRTTKLAVQHRLPVFDPNQDFTCYPLEEQARKLRRITPTIGGIENSDDIRPG